MTIRWPAESIWETVAPLLPGFTVEILPTIDSTNTELMRRARAGQIEPILLVAERQTAGRGRLGRDWQSDTQEGLATLTFSLGLPLQPADWSGLSLAVGTALVQALHPALKLKWPNDVWWDERKLAGILIETTHVGDVRFCVIGVGINLLARAHDGLRTPAAALCELLPQATAASTLQALVLPLVQMVQRFEAQGFAAVREDFLARDLLFGRAVRCTDGSSGTARGVDLDGALLLQTASGLQRIHSAEVSVRPVPGPVATPEP